MKLNHATLMGLLLLLAVSSCKSTKDITLFQSSPNEGTSFHLPPVPPEHKIAPFDNLYIKVLTLDTEVNKLFNPSSATEGTNTQMLYESPAGQYLNGYRVSSEGTISLPILGEINILGLTLNGAEEQIKVKAQEYLKDPIVQVKLLNFKLDILGEVSSPGIYYSYEGSINIVEALGLASGITNYANLRNVVVNRKVDNITTSYKIDLTKNTIYTSEVYYLKPNDVVYIPPSKLVRRGENTGTYSMVLSTLASLLVIITFFGIQP